MGAEPVFIASGDEPTGLRPVAALDDLSETFRIRRSIADAALFEIRRRYRRTVIGPFVSTLANAVIILASSVVFARVLDMPFGTYFAYVAVSFFAWSIIIVPVLESSDIAAKHAAMLKARRRPLSELPARAVAVAAVVGLHDVCVPVIAVLASGGGFTAATLTLPFFFVAVGAMLFPVCLLVMLAGARWPDLTKVAVTCGSSLAFFVTPIMWPVERLGDMAAYQLFNPAHVAIELIRAPLTGRLPGIAETLAAAAWCALFWAVALHVLTRARSRALMWL